MFMHVNFEVFLQILIYFGLVGRVVSSLKDVTSSVGLRGNNLGALAVFVDFNAVSIMPGLGILLSFFLLLSFIIKEDFFLSY